jgi:phospholipid/cholesterol/gamma-HCH transport system substrate-binding protein
MENKSHALAAGLFVLVVAAMLAGLAIWLTRDDANYEQYEMSTKDGVSGLQPQATVRYKGVAVGKVTRIGFDPQVTGNVLIRIAVNEQAPISPTTFAVLGYQGVTGLAHVQLDDEQQPYPELPPGPSGLPRLPLKPSPFGKLAEQAPAILTQVEEATRRINQLLGDTNQQLLTQTLGNISSAAAGVNTLTQKLDATVTQRLDPALASIPPLAGEARKTLQALQQAGNSVTTLASDFGHCTPRTGPGRVRCRALEPSVHERGACAARCSRSRCRSPACEDDTPADPYLEPAEEVIRAPGVAVVSLAHAPGAYDGQTVRIVGEAAQVLAPRAFVLEGRGRRRFAGSALTEGGSPGGHDDPIWDGPTRGARAHTAWRRTSPGRSARPSPGRAGS